jgi:hypothetical protein
VVGPVVAVVVVVMTIVWIVRVMMVVFMFVVCDVDKLGFGGIGRIWVRVERRIAGVAWVREFRASSWPPDISNDFLAEWHMNSLRPGALEGNIRAVKDRPTANARRASPNSLGGLFTLGTNERWFIRRIGRGRNNKRVSSRRVGRLGL